MNNFDKYNLYNNIHKLNGEIRNFYNHYLKKSDLTMNQYLMLEAVWENSGLSITDIGNILSIDRTSASRNVRPLIESGFLELKKGGDSRTKEVVITQEGENIKIIAAKLAELAHKKLMLVINSTLIDRLNSDINNTSRHILDIATE